MVTNSVEKIRDMSQIFPILKSSSENRQQPSAEQRRGTARALRGITSGRAGARHGGEDPRSHGRAGEPPAGPTPVGRRAVHPAARRPPRRAPGAASILLRGLGGRRSSSRRLPTARIHHPRLPLRRRSAPCSPLRPRSRRSSFVCGGAATGLIAAGPKGPKCTCMYVV